MKARTSAQYSITMRLEHPHEAGWIAKIATAIANAEGAIDAIDLVRIREGRSVRDYTVECSSTDHADQVLQAVKTLSDVKMHSVSDDTFLMHLGGKLEIASKVSLKTRAPLDGVHAVRQIRQAIHRDLGPLQPDDPQELHRRRLGRKCRARPRKHRPRRRHAGDGGQGHPLQGVRGVDAFPLCVDTGRR